MTDGCRLQSTNDNDDINKDYKSSGIVIPMLTKWDRESTKTSYSWDSDDLVNIKRCKPNIITARTSHYGSTGLYYSYGNRGNYQMMNNSSITQYAHKKYKCPLKSNESLNRAEKYNLLSAMDLKKWYIIFIHSNTLSQRSYCAHVECDT